MDIRLALAIAGLIAVVLRYVAARRVMGGDGRFAWLLLVPSILVGVALVSLTVTLAVESRLAAAAVAPVAIGYVGLLIWFGRRFQRTVSAPPNLGTRPRAYSTRSQCSRVRARRSWSSPRSSSASS